MDISPAPIIPDTTAFSVLDCETAFAALTPKQGLYAYNFAKASWAGSKICFFERSFESPALLYIILKSFEGGAKKVRSDLANVLSEE